MPQACSLALLARGTSEEGDWSSVGLVSRGRGWEGSSWDRLMSDRQGGGQGQELARGGGLGEPYVSDSNSIPTLRMGASPRKGKALRQQLRVLVDRLKASQWRGPSRRRFGTKAAHGSRGRGSNLAGAHASPYDNPHHTEKYDQVMEQRKWDALARKFRQEHPDMDPATEQKQLDALWYAETQNLHSVARQGLFRL